MTARHKSNFGDDSPTGKLRGPVKDLRERIGAHLVIDLIY